MVASKLSEFLPRSRRFCTYTNMMSRRCRKPGTSLQGVVKRSRDLGRCCKRYSSAIICSYETKLFMPIPQSEIEKNAAITGQVNTFNVFIK
jgi:hypothetical protein